MTPKEQVFVSWFKDEYLRQTRFAVRHGGELSAPESRVAASDVEEQMNSLKLINTSERGWFAKFDEIWKRVFPADWCAEVDARLLQDAELHVDTREHVAPTKSRSKSRNTQEDSFFDSRPYWERERSAWLKDRL